MRVRVKICGLTRAEDVEAAVAAGADAIGFVFCAESPRTVSPFDAALLARHAPPYVTKVAVLRHPAPREIAAVVRTFPADLVQFEVENRSALSDAWRARFVPVFHDREALLEQLTCFLDLAGSARPVVHLEGPGRGGRGVRADVERAREASAITRLVLAGGLDPANVGEAVVRVRPWAVDVSSGVESAMGIKDHAKIEAFIRAVRTAERAQERATSEESR